MAVQNWELVEDDMGRHEFVDNLITGIGGLYGESLKFFSNDMESPSAGELLGKVDLAMPAPDREGEYEVSATLEGKRIGTRFSVIEWAGEGAPVLIFHHGSGDQPYHSRIRKILGADPAGCTVIATDSPYNRTRKEYFEAVSSLRAFTEIFAGAAPDALFLDSSYSRLLTGRNPEKRENITSALNFEDRFTRQPTGNVYPLLARYDQYVVFDRQKGVYDPKNIAVMKKGHVTGGSANADLRKFLLRSPSFVGQSPS